MIKRFGLSSDAALRQIAEIVHDIDLKDDKFNRLEAAGLDAVIAGLAEALKDDRKLLVQCGSIFDGVYALLGQAAKKPKENTRRKAGANASKRKRRAPRK